MPNTKSIPADATGAFRKLCRYSCTFNLWRSLVRPLVVDLYGETANYKQTANILDLLTEIHKCMWHVSGAPLEFPGAVAGHFQELVFAFKKAEKNDDGRTVKVGAEEGDAPPKTGGDVWQIYADGSTKTYQFKVSNAADAKYIREHINKAGAQLTGQTGEAPRVGSTNVIYMIVQNTAAFDTYTAGDWKTQIEQALDVDYVSDRGNVNRPPRVVVKADIKAAVNKVKILTRNSRFRFINNNGAVQLTREDVISMDEAKYFTFSDGKFQNHWEWIRQTWWPANVGNLSNKAEVINQTKLNGIAADKAFQKLACQPTNM